jgi:hypothetical protein
MHHELSISKPIVAFAFDAFAFDAFASLPGRGLRGASELLVALHGRQRQLLRCLLAALALAISASRTLCRVANAYPQGQVRVCNSDASEALRSSRLQFALHFVWQVGEFAAHLHHRSQSVVSFVSSRSRKPFVRPLCIRLGRLCGTTAKVAGSRLPRVAIAGWRSSSTSTSRLAPRLQKPRFFIQ